MRKFLVAGNWKMNGSKEQTTALLQKLKELVADDKNIDCVVCPPNVFLDQAEQLIKSSNIKLGGQNVAYTQIAAFTGEISPLMLREFGCTYVIIGHSERRALLGESDDIIAAKFRMAIENGITPILCVGETQEQKDIGRGYAVVTSQLQAVLDVVGIEGFKDAVVAYEPVWAIGTGLTATPEEAQEMHAQIRSLLAAHDEAIALNVRIVYGGSMNPSNAKDLLQQEDIDGGLIGGASLKAQDFSEICHIANSLMTK